MPELPQIQDTQPTINPQVRSSKSEGYEAFGKTLGQIAGVAEENVKTMVSEQSQAMYINSVANIEQLKTGAQTRMLEEPGQARKIAEQTADIMEEVNTNAFVNKKDRIKLNAYIMGAKDDVELKAVATSVKQGQLEGAFSHYMNWPDQLKAYHDALLSNPEKADDLKDAMISTLHSLVSAGSLTPTQAGSQIQTMKGMVEIAQSHYKVYGDPNATAKDFHTVTSNPLVGNSATHENAPINHSTAWMVDYQNSDMSFQGVLSDISNRMLPNPQAFDSLTPGQRQHAIMAIEGAQVADGMINSGEPFPAIEKHLSDLNTKGRVLSYREHATKGALTQYVNKLKNGNYLDVMGADPQGNAIMRDFNDRNEAINSTYAYSPEGKDQAVMRNKNDMINAAVAWGDGRHIPREYIQPIPKADIALMENGFKAGQDPSAVLSMIGQYGKINQAYLANAMKDPSKRIAVQAVALAGPEVGYQDKLDFIAANQEGRNYAGKNLEMEKKDKELMTRVYTTLSPQLKLLQQTYGFENAQKLQMAMLDTTLKYAKYVAQKDNNIQMEDKEKNIFSDASWKKYIDKATNIYTDAYKQQSGSNWIVNPNQLAQPYTTSDFDTLAEYAIHRGNKYIQGGIGDDRYNQMMGRGTLKMVISPTNDLQAINANGDVAFSEPLNTNTLAYAKRSLKEIAKEKIEKTRSELPAIIERQERERLHVRLPNDAG